MMWLVVGWKEAVFLMELEMRFSERVQTGLRLKSNM